MKEAAKDIKGHRKGEKFLLKHISDKGLVSEIHKELLKLINKKTTNAIKK